MKFVSKTFQFEFNLFKGISFKQGEKKVDVSLAYKSREYKVLLKFGTINKHGV